MVRVLWLLKALTQGNQVSVSELAKRFGTRRETIYRDLRTLEDVGYPIQGDENGKLSHPRVLGAKHSANPEVQLTGDEYSALVFLIETASAATPFAKDLENAAAKLKAMQKRPSSQQANLQPIFSSSQAGLKRPASQHIMANLVKAILTRHSCHVTYRSPSSQAEKCYEYHPYKLRAVAGGIYCLGRIPAVEGITTLATERILSLSLSSQSFAVESNLDVKRCEDEAFGVTIDNAMTVVVRFRAEQAPYIKEREWHPTQRIQEQPDGGLEITFRAGGTFEIEQWILGWGEAAEVIAPESLRASVQSRCQAMAKVYQ